MEFDQNSSTAMATPIHSVPLPKPVVLDPLADKLSDHSWFRNPDSEVSASEDSHEGMLANQALPALDTAASGHWEATQGLRLEPTVERIDPHEWYPEEPPILGKRCFDICFSLFAIVLVAPIGLLVALAIKSYDRGPIFFAQRRVGKNGRVFSIYKFRSMLPSAEAVREELEDKNEYHDPRSFKIRSDPRVTPVGSVIRRLSLDELPQFWNVLTGDMSVVGPRPPIPDEVKHYTWTDFRKFSVQPGLTCIWQVSDRRNMSFEERSNLDNQYIEQRSLWMDLRLIVRTIPAMLLGRGAC